MVECIAERWKISNAEVGLKGVYIAIIEQQLIDLLNDENIRVGIYNSVEGEAIPVDILKKALFPEEHNE